MASLRVQHCLSAVLVFLAKILSFFVKFGRHVGCEQILLLFCRLTDLLTYTTEVFFLELQVMRDVGDNLSGSRPRCRILLVFEGAQFAPKIFDLYSELCW